MLSVQKPKSFDLFQHLHKISQIITVITNSLFSGLLDILGKCRKDCMKQFHLFSVHSAGCTWKSPLESSVGGLCWHLILSKFHFWPLSWPSKVRNGSFTAKILHNLLNKDEMSWLRVKHFSIKVGTDDWHPCILLVATLFNSFVASCTQAWEYSWNMSR